MLGWQPIKRQAPRRSKERNAWMLLPVPCASSCRAVVCRRAVICLPVERRVRILPVSSAAEPADRTRICAASYRLAAPVGRAESRPPHHDQRISSQPCSFRITSRPPKQPVGGVAEWSNAPVLKTDVGGSLPWVRIPPPPPLALAKAFSRSGCGRIFPLFSRVMRVGLSTGPGARRPGSGLSGPIFSGPDDCADSVQTATYLFLWFFLDPHESRFVIADMHPPGTGV